MIRGAEKCSFAPQTTEGKDTPKEKLDPTYDFVMVMRSCHNKLFQNTKTGIFNDIAPTETFQMNLYGLVACIDAKMPFAIVGPAGCGKTLAFATAAQSMGGKRNDLYKELHSIITWRHQVSVHSTDKEIQEIFFNAIQRQEIVNQNQQCVVFLDETSLSKDENLLLKETHDTMDHPQVSAVVLSNAVMDAPNTNRVVLLVQTSLSDEELQQVC